MSRASTEIQLDLDAFYSLRRQAATNGGIAEYSMDSGQGRHSVKQITLGEINATIRQLEGELNSADAETSGPTSARFDRGGGY